MHKSRSRVCRLCILRECTSHRRHCVTGDADANVVQSGMRGCLFLEMEQTEAALVSDGCDGDFDGRSHNDRDIDGGETVCACVVVDIVHVHFTDTFHRGFVTTSD